MKRTDTEILNALQDLPWRIDILYKQGQPKSDSVPHIAPGERRRADDVGLA